MGMKPADSDLLHCNTLNLDEKYNCQRLKHIKCLVNTHKVYNNDFYCVWPDLDPNYMILNDLCYTHGQVSIQLITSGQ